ncbi:MAG: hypothetical protein B6D72_19765 [gamma proteobacterium symbiont of Ctena orbiculata]|uniref:Alpha/beta hydrolase family protein n=1 Tax=Candidatus Thiodiazotropha taylori TaxID=2792791 RepID=A0A944M4R3_9GAMM|nr:alpha/beta hydrolase family protein [Candidatus Thiodiazotropha taylori]PVV06695.1 MAG: hypothetical protein B6D72_19765 [gamma proteobacterium symbiont of Ctena orbiculata]MBT2987486.1 alpha/beta hydrolase family protein [Candidatus Thiodiazotropha taylori]MBT2995258.1 alpha/beta hydrolase family protein [Candidatus Thiodiazotropha taylori]MBT2999823.1 alpha/beta hydrolase family protein [Candidatus Thiodiazotropha taylori]
MRRSETPAHLCCLLLLLIIASLESLHAANLSREQRISEGLTGGALIGDPVWLEAGSVRFLAIHMESFAAVRRGGAILLHDSGAHADWHEVINPLRHHLAERGWETLSLQLPLGDDPSDLSGSASLLSLSRPRIKAGIDFLNGRQIEETVLIGHGLGAAMAMDFIAGQGEGIGALVAIGITPGGEGEEEPLARVLGVSDVPILDLYGSLDLPAVVDSARERRTLAVRNGRDRYRQERVSGADHFFSGMQEELNNRIAAWLRQAAGERKPAQRPSTP